MTIKPAGAAAATIVSLAALGLLHPRIGVAVYTISLILIFLVVHGRDGSRVGRKLLGWSVPFVLPLLLIHGILNTQFPVTNWWFDTIPIRSAGLAFGGNVAMRILLLSVVAVFWISVDGDAFVEALLRLRLPAPLIMLAVQGFVMGRLVQRRIEAIHRAQRARGIPVSASFVQRVGSIPALLIPVVIGTFIEAEARVPVMLAHGYGRLEPSTKRMQFELGSAILALAIVASLALAVAADRLS